MTILASIPGQFRNEFEHYDLSFGSAALLLNFPRWSLGVPTFFGRTLLSNMGLRYSASFREKKYNHALPFLNMIYPLGQCCFFFFLSTPSSSNLARFFAGGFGIKCAYSCCFVLLQLTFINKLLLSDFNYFLYCGFVVGISGDLFGYDAFYSYSFLL